MPWEDVLRATDRHPADHGRLHRSAPLRADPRRRPGAVDGRSGQRRRHRAMPGGARPAEAAPRPGWRPPRTLDENDVGLSYTRTFLVPNKIDLPEAAGRLATAARIFARWTSRNMSFRPGTGTGLEELRDGDLPVAGRDSRLQQAAHGQGARPRSPLHASPRRHAAGAGRAGPQGFSHRAEVRPRLGRGGPRRHGGQGRLRAARQGRSRIARMWTVPS